jgi:formate hydrogenlyase subunit 3/multisubunit Na+/H+ antiporter MnhD subunit
MKAAWMPFHAWLPGAMVAPAPVSGLLHAVAVVKAGVFGFVRIVCYVFGIDLMSALGLGIILGIVASFTMIVASFVAIGQDNLKKRLAYSTISQLSYILFGAALLTSYGVTGAMLHIPFHGFMKITIYKQMVSLPGNTASRSSGFIGCYPDEFRPGCYLFFSYNKNRIL